jgi:hypothetical protein
MVVLRWDCLDKLIIPVNSSCTAGKSNILSTSPLVRKGKISLRLRKVIHYKLKSVGCILSIETINSNFSIVSPFNGVHDISLF